MKINKIQPVRMKYQGKDKTIKLPAGAQTPDLTEIFMVADVKTGDVAEFDNDRTLHFAKLARCIDGSPAWIPVTSKEIITLTFNVMQPKLPNRRTSWKSRDQRK